MGSPRILLTGCGSPAAQNVLQCLRLAAERMHIVGADASRYHLEWGDLDAAYESPLTSDPGYLRFVIDLCRAERIDLIHGQPDWEVAFLSAHRGQLPAITFLPSHHVVATAQDKFASACLWWHARLRSDLPIFVRGESEMRQAADLLGLPFWLRATTGAGARGSCKVVSVEQGATWLKYWRLSGCSWEFFAQAYLPGPEYAFQSLWHRGRLIASTARERLEFVFPQHAPSGVTSSPVVARSVHDRAVNRTATDAILALDGRPHGVYGVDLRCDAEGAPRPTEVNAGRFFTTSLFPASAGCNLPLIYVRLALGQPLRSARRYDAVPPGLYWIRHIDCGARLVREGDWKARKAKAPPESQAVFSNRQPSVAWARAGGDACQAKNHLTRRRHDATGGWNDEDHNRKRHPAGSGEHPHPRGEGGAHHSPGMDSVSAVAARHQDHGEGNS